jgi:hypothetical protein
MSTSPPEFAAARWVFSAACLILAMRLGWWIAIEQVEETSSTKAAIAFFLFGVLGILWTTAIGWVNTRQKSFTSLTQPKNASDPQSDKTTAQLRLEELQRRQTHPYTIRKADQEEFIRILKLAGKYSVDIAWDINSDLAGLFAEELRTLLRLSEWNVNEPSVVVVTGPRPLKGVIITVNENQEIPLGASLLLDLLTKQDIDAQLLSAPPRKVLQASFYIFIGPKP